MKERKDKDMTTTTSPSRPLFGLNVLVWVMIVAVLLVVLAAAVLYLM